jgi:hypothetical protein
MMKRGLALGRICFNTTPADSAEAVQRILGPQGSAAGAAM